MLLSQLTCTQFLEWQAYYAIEPFGEQREELRHGQKMAQFANHYQRDPKRDPEPYPAIDFMNYTERPEEPEPVVEDPDELSARILREVFGHG